MNIKIEKLSPEYTYIYTLSDKNGNIRYVGKSNDPNKRYVIHLRDINGNTYKNHWLKKLKKNKIKPILEILDIVLVDEHKFWEKYWIEQCKNWGFKLTNSTKGGEGIIKPIYGKKCSEETKKKLSIINKGKKLSNKTKDKIRLTSLGRTHTTETKKKCSQIHKGKTLTEDHKKKLSQVKIGKKLSEETKEKMSISRSGEKNHNYGKIASDETKLKMSIVRKGKKISEETKANMKIAQIARRLKENI